MEQPDPRHFVISVGGAVAGSEAAFTSSFRESTAALYLSECSSSIFWGNPAGMKRFFAMLLKVRDRHH